MIGPPLRTNAVNAAIVGVRNRHQVGEIIEAADFHLNPEGEEIEQALHLKLAKSGRE